jgi:hypothetical protein
MLSGRHLKRELSVVALLCTLVIFLHAAPTGPYSVVHGPTTALRALQASIAIFGSIVFAALSLALTLSPPFAYRKHFRASVGLVDFARVSATGSLRC